MTHRILRDVQANGWESSDFPIICESYLGDNPYIRMIVKTYFGRQEISSEDLEAALLVGMSPHERRRFEKKRGLSFRHNEQNVIYKTDGSVPEQTINNDGTNNSVMHIQKVSSEYEHKDTDSDHGGSSSSSTLEPSTISIATGLQLGDNPLVASTIQVLDRIQEIEHGNVSNLEKYNENEDQSDDSVNLLPFMSHAVASGNAKKISLLGHGPHGKHVVDHLLTRYGEDGVRQFCQRWRKVFVDAIQPRFLPSGWDIMHSGRRDFGDHSVYNPSKKALPEPNDFE